MQDKKFLIVSKFILYISSKKFKTWQNTWSNSILYTQKNKSANEDIWHEIRNDEENINNGTFKKYFVYQNPSFSQKMLLKVN